MVDCLEDDWGVEIGTCFDDSSGQILVQYFWLDNETCGTSANLPSDERIGCATIPTGSNWYIGLSSLAIVGGAICFSNALIIFLLRHRPTIRVAQIWFMFIFALSATLLCVGAFLKLGEPDTFKCIAATWVSHLSMFSMISAIVQKLYRVWRISIGNANLRRIRITDGQLMIGFTFNLILPLAVLTWWTLVSPIQVVEFKQRLLSGAIVTQQICSSDSFLYEAILIGLCGFFILIGLYFAFSMRRLSNVLTDGQSIRSMIHNITAFWALGFMLMMFSSPDVANKALPVIQVATAVSSVLILMIPRYRTLSKTSENLLDEVDFSKSYRSYRSEKHSHSNKLYNSTNESRTHHQHIPMFDDPNFTIKHIQVV